MAIHDDVLPQLQVQLADAQNQHNDLLAAETSARIAQETEKRKLWNVRFPMLFLLYQSILLISLTFF